MPFTLNLYTDRLKRQSDRCPRFLDLNLHLLKTCYTHQHLLCQSFRNLLQKLKRMTFQILCDKCTCFSIMDRCSQLICQSCPSGIRIHNRRHHKFLPQYIFLRKHTMIGKYFQIFYLYLVRFHLIPHSFYTSCPRMIAFVI